MAGGLMQLVAYGAQDVYLTGNPEVTFYQAKYKRHTNFAMENIEQTLNGNPASSGRVSVTIARNGDLVGDMYVELKTVAGGGGAPEWAAERAISSVELSIGGQRVDKQYQKWWRLYTELYLDEAKKATYGKMTTAAAEKTVFLPLLFFFNRNPGLYLPLIALQYHEVRIDFDLSGSFETHLDKGVFKVWANYVYLDTEERRRFAQKGHEYLIEQTQHTGVDTVGVSGTKQIRLSYNHPIKELVWCLTGDEVDSLWNFGVNCGVANKLALTSGPKSGSSTEMDALPISAASGVPLVVTGGDGTNAVGTREAFTEEAQGAMTEFKLVLNGQDRFKAQGGKYFNQVQPFQHHSGSPFPGVYAYSFALKPEEHQPTGTCNFSRIDNAQVAITTANATNCTNLHMFATNYNVLRIQSGMGGLAFSN